VGELLDMVERSGVAREEVVTRHPLQPFDPRNFSADAPWSFDLTTLEGARALCGERVAAPPFLTGPLDDVAEPVVELADLVSFVERPVRTFLRRRLRIAATEYSDEVEDALPVELGPLDEYGVGTRLLEARLAGVEQRTAILAEIARGTLPPRRARQAGDRSDQPGRRGDRRARPASGARRRWTSRSRSAAHAARHDPGRAATAGARTVLARCARASGSSPGCGCSR
jgi:hypothetical protein